MCLVWIFYYYLVYYSAILLQFLPVRFFSSLDSLSVRPSICILKSLDSLSPSFSLSGIMSKLCPQSKVSPLLSSSAKVVSIALPAEYLFLLLSARLQLQRIESYYYLLLHFYLIYWTLGGGDIYTNISSYNVAKVDWIIYNLAMLYWWIYHGPMMGL